MDKAWAERIENNVNALVEVVSAMSRQMATKDDIANMATKDDIAEIREVMATKDDIALIVSHMATKEDLEDLATKADIADMATKDDIALIVDNMATKEDIINFATKENLDVAHARIDQEVSKHNQLEVRVVHLERIIEGR